MKIAKNARSMKRALLLSGVAVPFLFTGWYGAAASGLAAVIKHTIPEKLNNGDKIVATTAWCTVAGGVLATASWAPFLIAWPAITACMTAVAWPDKKPEKLEFRNNDGETVFINDAEVIDV